MGQQEPSSPRGRDGAETPSEMGMVNNLNNSGGSATLLVAAGSQGAAEPYPPDLRAKKPPSHHFQGTANTQAPTVCLQPGRFAVPAARLVYGLDQEDVAGAALEPVDSVVVLLDVGDDHPAVHGVVETCSTGEWGRFTHRKDRIQRPRAANAELTDHASLGCIYYLPES